MFQMQSEVFSYTSYNTLTWFIVGYTCAYAYRPTYTTQ